MRKRVAAIGVLVTLMLVVPVQAMEPQIVIRAIGPRSVPDDVQAMILDGIRAQIPGLHEHYKQSGFAPELSADEPIHAEVQLADLDGDGRQDAIVRLVHEELLTDMSELPVYVMTFDNRQARVVNQLIMATDAGPATRNYLAPGSLTQAQWTQAFNGREVCPRFERARAGSEDVMVGFRICD